MFTDTTPHIADVFIMPLYSFVSLKVVFDVGCKRGKNVFFKIIFLGIN